MQTDVRRTIDTTGKIKRIIRFIQILRKGIAALSQANQIPLFHPTGKVVSIEIGLPGQNLIHIKPGLLKHPVSKFNKTHYFYFYNSTNIVKFRNKTKNQKSVTQKSQTLI